MPNGRTASQNDLIGRVDELGPAFAERAAGFDSAARFPTENYDDLRDAGLLKLCIPVAAGGT
ncbi:MAG: acyl-CoA dehydrogenase, partial [Pseudomonadota bacterium]|nr:acyl-CoA dehydrogenase [Pseudomonadota bacterium]